MTDCDLVLSGSGTLLPCHIGAVHRLSAVYRVRRVAGTSGGAIVAAALAHGMDTDEMLLLCRELFAEGILDRRPFGLLRDGWGLHAFDRVHAFAQRHLPGSMSKAELTWGAFVVDVETRKPVWLNSRRHGNLSTADVVTASASIPFFARARPIQGLPGLFIDGGVSANFALGVWDDLPDRPTIGVRFRGGGARRTVDSLPAFVRSVVGTLIDNANRTHISKKRYADVIEIDSDGDGMDFGLSPADIERRYEEGRAAADAWLRGERE